METIANIQEVETIVYPDQKAGTSGLRKLVKEASQPHYIQNFIDAALKVLCSMEKVDLSQSTFIIGGDGRYYNDIAIQSTIK